MSSITSTSSSISCCSSLSPSLNLLHARRRLLKSSDAAFTPTSTINNTTCRSVSSIRFFTSLILFKPRCDSNHSCGATNNSEFEREESRWLREEHRWLREEQRWLREEARWNAERDGFLREISQLRTKIQELESERHNSASVSVAEGLLSRVTSLLQVLNLNTRHGPETAAGDGDGNGVLDYGVGFNRIAKTGASVKPLMFAENEEDVKEENFEVAVKNEEPKTKKKIEERRALRVGSEGEDVRLLQEALQSLGFYSGEEEMEYSSFSTGTERAVKTWQASLGARENGIMTAELLDRLYAEKQVENYKEDDATGAPAASVTEVAKVQRTVLDERIAEVEIPKHRVFLLGENRWEEPSRLTDKKGQSIKFQVSPAKCLSCRGEGRLMCIECDGTGEPNIEPQFLEWVNEEAKCPYCEGLGYTLCDACVTKTVV